MESKLELALADALEFAKEWIDKYEVAPAPADQNEGEAAQIKQRADEINVCARVMVARLEYLSEYGTHLRKEIESKHEATCRQIEGRIEDHMRRELIVSERAVELVREAIEREENLEYDIVITDKDILTVDQTGCLRALAAPLPPPKITFFHAHHFNENQIKSLEEALLEAMSASKVWTQPPHLEKPEPAPNELPPSLPLSVLQNVLRRLSVSDFPEKWATKLGTEEGFEEVVESLEIRQGTVCVKDVVTFFTDPSDFEPGGWRRKIAPKTLPVCQATRMHGAE